MFTRKATSLYSLASVIMAATLVAHAQQPTRPGPPPNAGPRNGCTVRPGDPSTGIQHAVDSGCTQIRVAPGTYYEHVTIPVGDTVTITGTAGASKTIVDGTGSVFASVFVNYGNLTLTGLTIRNGGGVYNNGGGIYNNGGVLTLNDSIVTKNFAEYYGGGIFNSGTATLNNSTVSGNSADVGGGGGIYNSGGVLTLNNSTVSGNSAPFGDGGGGIYYLATTSSSLTLNNSTVSGNSASNGGGISAQGDVTLNNSTVSGNSADSRGGGIFINGVLTLNNSTVSGNTPDDVFTL